MPQALSNAQIISCDDPDMRIEGRLTRWNDERGFGFITPAAGGEAVFAHIAAFPDDGRRPAVGERVVFEIEMGADGKQRAVNVLCPDRPRAAASAPARRPAARRPAGRRRSRGLGITLALAAGLVAYGHNVYTRHAAVDAPPVTPQLSTPVMSSQPERAPAQRQPAPMQPSPSAHAEPSPTPAQVEPVVPLPVPAPANHHFRCDGRTHCSQMTSCDEATYFLQNCPGTEMDGDGDGVPCESQWCRW